MLQIFVAPKSYANQLIQLKIRIVNFTEAGKLVEDSGSIIGCVESSIAKLLVKPFPTLQLY